jgi:hypothetical protein
VLHYSGMGKSGTAIVLPGHISVVPLNLFILCRVRVPQVPTPHDWRHLV